MPDAWDSVDIGSPSPQADAWDSVPISGDGAATPKKKKGGVLQTLFDLYEKKKAEAEAEQKLSFGEYTKKRLKEGVSDLGNVALPGIGTLGSAVSQVRKGIQGRDSKPLAIESILPTPTYAGIAKGLVDTPLAIGQGAAHLTGVGEKTMDRTVDATQGFYDRNFDRSATGEAVGQMLPFIGSGGASAVPQAASKARRALEILKTAGKNISIPIATTPEAYLKNGEDYASRKFQEGVTGLGLGVAIPTAMTVARGLKSIKNRIGGAPSVAEIQGEVGKDFGDLSPGQYLKNKAIDIYEEPLARHDALMDQLRPLAAERKTDYQSTLATLDRIIGEHNDNVSQMRPDQIDQIVTLRDRIRSAITPSRAALESNGVRGYLNGEQNMTSYTVGGSDISNDLGGLIKAYQDLGKPLGTNLNRHGDRLSRGTLQDIRAAMLDDMHSASSDMGGKWDEARAIFRDEIVPLFDRKQGGNLLTKIRDAWNPDDVLRGFVAGNKVNKAQKIASGASADPMIWQALENAKQTAAGRPGGYSGSIDKAIPMIEGIADPALLQKIKDSSFVARAAGLGGSMADAGVAYGLNAIPVVGPFAAGGYGLHAFHSPATSGRGGVWALLQTPSFRKALSAKTGIPETSPEFDKVLARYASVMASQNKTQEPEQ